MGVQERHFVGNRVNYKCLKISFVILYETPQKKSSEKEKLPIKEEEILIFQLSSLGFPVKIVVVRH